MHLRFHHGWLLSAALFSGCAFLQGEGTADTPEHTEKTAYYVCGGCHGRSDVRMNTMSPTIIGQKKGYLVAKLKDYRDGKRVHPWMNGIARDLTDQDIASLADHFSAWKPADQAAGSP